MPSRGVLAGMVLVLLFVVGLLVGLLNKQREPEPAWVDAKDVPFLEQETLPTLELPTATAGAMTTATPEATPTTLALDTPPGASPTPVRTAIAFETRAPRTQAPARTPALEIDTPFVEDTPVADDSPPPTEAPTPDDTELPIVTDETTSTPGATPAAAGVTIRSVTQTASGEASVVRIELSDDLPEYRVFRVRNPARVIVDFEETSVPSGLAVSGDATALVRDVTTRHITNPNGTAPIGRVQILLGDTGDKLPSVSESKEDDALVITIRSPAL